MFERKLLHCLETRAEGADLDMVGLAIALRPTQAEIVSAIAALIRDGRIDAQTLRPIDGRSEETVPQREPCEEAEPPVASTDGTPESVPSLKSAEELAAQPPSPPAPEPTIVPPSKELRPTGAQLFKRIAAECDRRGLTKKQASLELFGQATQLSTMKNNTGRAAAAKTFAKVQAWLEASSKQPAAAERDAGDREHGVSSGQPERSDEAPPPAAAVEGAETLPEVPSAPSKTSRPTGAELAAELDALIVEHGLSKKHVGVRLFGSSGGIECLRRKPRPYQITVDKVRALIADPPIEELRGKRTWTRRAPPAPRDPTAPPDTDAGDRQVTKVAQLGASIRRGQEQAAAEKLDAGLKPKNSFERALMGNIERRREEEARQADPVEQAKLALQRKGRTVYSASVVGGPKHLFVVSGLGTRVTPADLINEAERVTGQQFRRSADAAAPAEGRAANG